MKARTKLTLTVGLGTIVIELGLLSILGFVFVEGAKLMLAPGGSMDLTKGSVMLAILATELALLFLVYNEVSNYLRTRMCRAFVRYFHGKE